MYSKSELLALISILILLLVACAGQGKISPTASPESQESLASPSAELATSAPTPSATSGPPPAGFESEILRPGVEPVSYINDSCRYLELRWDPERSAPGTVVAVIMYHSVLEGNATPSLPQDINKETFDEIIRLAKELGFETVTTEQLLDFLQENTKIPLRSMLLVLDDRKPGTAEDYFLPVLEENDWTLTLAWIIGDTDQRRGRLAGEGLWDWIERIYASGYFDVQAHGLNHIPITEGLTRTFVREEVGGSIPVLIEHFGQRPVAYVWPGGNFTELGVQVAKEEGFELGFTVHSRGPILFNWIPQGEPEREIGEPFMTLPRFWDTAALLNLERTVEMGDAARQFARENYEAEAAWFAAN